MDDSLILQPDHKTARKVFSRIGAAFFVLVASTIILQIMIAVIAGFISEGLETEAWYIWMLSIAPYLATIPIFWSIVKKIPAVKISPQHMGAGQFCVLLIMCIGILYAGGIIGSVVSAAIQSMTGLTPTNWVQEIVLGSDWIWNMLFAVILAPFIEELLFRKLLIDRIVKFGEGIAVLSSALLFGLFHGNLHQFFYAFGLGAMFAYVYIKTGKLKYPVVLHMVINFMGSVLAPAVLSYAPELDLLETVPMSNDQTAGLFLAGLYTLVFTGLGLAGIVLLIVRRKTFVLNKASSILPKEKRLYVVWLNAGTLLFILACLFLFVFSLLQ